MRPIAALAALSMFGLPAFFAGAQQPTREVPDAVTCSRCVVNFRQLLTLNAGDSALTWIPDDVLVARDGSIIVAEFGELPRRFARDGRYLGEVGTRGQGPGEFVGTVGFARAPGDSLLAIQIDGRIVIVGASGTARRHVTLPTILFPLEVVEWPSRVLASGSLGSPERGGSQLHLLDLSGPQARVVASFDGERGRSSTPGTPPMQQKITPVKDGRFWTADPLEYRLSQWSVAGERIAQLRRAPEWFSGRSYAGLGNPTTSPPPSIVGIAEDAEGLLWVYSRRPRLNWQAGWPQVARGTRELSVRSIDQEKLFEVVVEVIDPRRGRVVARQTLGPLAVDILDNGDVVTYRASEDGIPELSIIRPRLTRP